MRKITQWMLLASVLAIGAGSIAACGNTDCPSTVVGGESCSTDPGLVCYLGSDRCSCSNGNWSCAGEGDLPVVIVHDLSTVPRDLAVEHD